MLYTSAVSDRGSRRGAGEATITGAWRKLIGRLTQPTLLLLGYIQCLAYLDIGVALLPSRFHGYLVSFLIRNSASQHNDNVSSPHA